MPGLLCGVKRSQHDSLAGSAKSGLRITINSALNLGFADWTQVFGDPVMTAALLDRLTHKAHIVSCPWDSYRLKQSLKEKRKQGKATHANNGL